MQQMLAFPEAETLLTAGVDEAGRGPLFGAVFAAAVILNPKQPIDGLNDSKKLSEKRREQLFIEIKAKALAFSIARAEAAEIDRLNILHASLLAMQRAVEGLFIHPEQVLVDGNRCPKLALPCQAIVGGDGTVAAIAAASILAKVSRDHDMRALDERYPGYGLAAHKGYPTRAHLAALARLGAPDQHRRSFAPVRAVLG